MKDKKLISLELSVAMIRRLKELAAEQEITVSALIRTILKGYINHADAQQ